MRTINLWNVDEEEWRSPGGGFVGFGRQVSIALGAVPNARLHAGGHPFDLEVGRLPAGCTGCPFHSHATQWELFVILEGTGRVRHGREILEVGPGSAVMHPPGEPHQLINTGTSDMRYLLVADNPAVDIWHYPDSDKWGFKPPVRHFCLTDINYYAGEEPGDPAPPPPRRPQQAPHPCRWTRIDDLPWELRRSPKGNFESSFRDISLALGGIRDQGLECGGQPFDLQIRRIPVGKAVGPYHAHSHQWEMYLVLAGEASVRHAGGSAKLGPDDVALFHPGEPHQFANAGTADLNLLIIADNPPAESIFLPDSGLLRIMPGGRWGRFAECQPYAGEE
jgi:uncharacterized cupin superfamily protein